MLRNRDIVAAVLALILTRMAWNDQAENLSASIHLAFYFPFLKGQVSPAAFDVDGDGTAEALVTVLPVGGENNYVVQLLDLKPLHTSYNAKTALGAPFQPRELLRSDPISLTNDGQETIKPLQIVTGQIMVRGLARGSSEKDFDAMSLDERTKHYFCGTDWHDASTKCGTPCPSGTADACPSNERCYADTPCDSSKPRRDDLVVHEDNYHLTPAGGMPSCFTIWSDGSVTMHSLTSLKEDAEQLAEPLLDPKNLTVATLGAKLKRTLTSQKKSNLQFQPMWTTKAIPSLEKQILNPFRVQLTFLDAFDAVPDAKHGMLIVSGDIADDTPPEAHMAIKPPEDPMKVPRFVVALDAMTGEILWDSLQNFEETPEEDVLLPVHLERGGSSLARRRSKVAKLDESMSSASGGEHGNQGKGSVLPNCLSGYRYSLLGATDALPYAYWGPADAGIRAVHLDHSNTQRKFHRHEQHHAHKHRTALSSSSSSSQIHQPGETSPHHHHHRQLNKKDKKSAISKTHQSWQSALLNPRKQKQHHGKHGGHVHYGRPNVIINFHAGGLHVHSLQNGQPLCRLSLLEEALYVDLQRDGVIDTIQVITAGKNLVIDPTTGSYADPWVEKLAARVTEAENREKDIKERTKDAKRSYHPASRLCHALALSGLPAREELFSTPLCGTSGNKLITRDGANAHNMWKPVFAAPPLVVESMYPQHRHREKDIIFAMSNGVVSRVRGGTGRRQWKLNGDNEENFPSWGHWESSNTVSLTRLRVDDFEVAPYARPILLVGESSIALLSATSGSVLAATNAPQRSLRRPILVDVSGDGVTDVMVISADAVWGYQVIVRTGASIFFRILVGLLLMGILLALLRNRYGSTSVRDRYKRSTDA